MLITTRCVLKSVAVFENNLINLLKSSQECVKIRKNSQKYFGTELKKERSAKYHHLRFVSWKVWWPLELLGTNRSLVVALRRKTQSLFIYLLILFSHILFFFCVQCVFEDTQLVKYIIINEATSYWPTLGLWVVFTCQRGTHQFCLRKRPLRKLKNHSSIFW